MKSVKPGRGPSALGAAGSLASVIFGILWTVFTFSITRGTGAIGLIFPLFGVIFIVLGIVNTVYHYKNATGKNRMSLIDITDGNEEIDPLNAQFGTQLSVNSEKSSYSTSKRKFEGDFCPYCGAKVEGDFDFCPKCGKDI